MGGNQVYPLKKNLKLDNKSQNRTMSMNAILVNNKEFYLKVLTYIDDSEKELVIKAIRDLQKYEQFDLSWKICLSNSLELSKLCNELKNGIDEKVLISESDLTLAKYNLGKLIVNFLSSYYNFVTFCEIYSKKWFGEEGYADMKKITSKHYDDGFVYKFYYKFRNYITHCGLPIDTSHINNNEGVKKLHFIIFKEKILSFDKWGKSLINWFDNAPESIDITGLFIGCHTMASFLAKDIHDYILQQIGESVNLMANKLGDNINSHDTYRFYIFDEEIQLEKFD